MSASLRVGIAFVTLLAALVGTTRSAAQSKAAPNIDLFFQATGLDAARADAALAQIAARWKDGYAAIVVDLVDLMGRTSPVDPQSWIRTSRLIQFLETQTSKQFGTDLNRWREWVWTLPYDPHPEYGAFKGRLYSQVDPSFADFFREPLRTAVRLDEVEWGGVTLNGIPPLEYPRHVAAADAGYLEDDNVVFGVHIDGVARAYPKRILAWHELARDRVGSVELTLVYCTLCGTVIPYDSRAGGVVRTFGPSGVLYRSNRVMADAETHSLWSSLSGSPIIGPLVGSGLRLSMLPVVTTAWGEWRRAHPQTTVLSIDTGFKRDYSEGAAYRKYFATNTLMFGVSKRDYRLRNKAEVLALRLTPPSGGPTRPVAIAADLLLKERVYHVDVAEQHLVVVTTAAGANRVYQAGLRRFRATNDEGRLVDTDGRGWMVEEDQLRATFDSALRLPRVPAHRAFWFGWYAQFPDTQLIK